MQTKLLPQAADFERKSLEKQIEKKGDNFHATIVGRWQDYGRRKFPTFIEKGTLGELLHRLPKDTPQLMFDFNDAWNCVKHYDLLVARDGKAAVEARLAKHFSTFKPMLLNGTLDSETSDYDGLVRKKLGV